MIFKSLSIAVFATAVFLPLSHAQMRGSVSGAPPRSGSVAGASISNGELRNSSSRRVGMRHSYPPFLLGDPYYYADYTSQPPAAEIQPQVVVVQVPGQAAVADAKGTSINENKNKEEPLLIEWRGDQYVRIGESQTESQATNAPADTNLPATRRTQVASHTTHAQPSIPEPVVLVYRDGHREEVRAYTIANGILYASADYWTAGYWTRKIQLTALNLPATQAAQASGTRFLLPNSPNEVVTGP